MPGELYPGLQQYGHIWEARTPKGKVRARSKAVLKLLRVALLRVDAQKFRTPRGLDLLKQRSGRLDHNATLAQMETQFQHSAMWMEGIWEIVRARRSPTTFLVSDDPITFYNQTDLRIEWRF